jgi:hypothetical protein
MRATGLLEGRDGPAARGSQAGSLEFDIFSIESIRFVQFLDTDFETTDIGAGLENRHGRPSHRGDAFGLGLFEKGQ